MTTFLIVSLAFEEIKGMPIKIKRDYSGKFLQMRKNTPQERGRRNFLILHNLEGLVDALSLVKANVGTKV